MRHLCCGPYRRPAWATHYSVTNYSPGHRHEARAHGFGRGGNFGVRRPLRYLRYHLDLDDSQSRRIAAVLNRIKLEREQAEIDEKRTLQALAGLLSADEMNSAEVKAALSPRVKSAERMQNEIAQAVQEICAALDPDQRAQFADLVASGVISL